MTNTATAQRATEPMPLPVKAIPISMDLKRYYWKKYCWLRKQNGVVYAAQVFKDLSTVLMGYVADTDRLQNLDSWISKCPVRKNGWLKQLFSYADTDPLSVLQFVRLYTSEREPAVKLDDAVAKQHEVLLQARPTARPASLEAMLRIWGMKRSTFERQLRIAVDNLKADLDDQGFPGSSLGQFRKISKLSNCDDGISVILYKSYLRLTPGSEPKKQVEEVAERIRDWRYKWLRLCNSAVGPKVLSKLETSATHRVLAMLPSPLSYAKVEFTSVRPLKPEYEMFFTPLETDFARYLVFAREHPHNYQVLADVAQTMHLDEGKVIDTLERNCFPLGLPERGYSGEIHLIPKKGDFSWRAVAAGNRFLQAESLPFRDLLRSLARKLPRNCEFDQSKLDGWIRTNLQDAYVGSVDLSQATDWLPVDWFELIWNSVFMPRILHSEGIPNQEADDVYHHLLESKRIYDDARRGLWALQGDQLFYEDRWSRGQPLGMFPSFEILTITHYLVLEALSIMQGRLDSPFAVLGDDVILTDPSVRSAYIRLMDKVGSPLSLHKSFDGRMVEFAGKLFIKNQPTAFRPALKMVGWSNLLDWQGSSGLPIRYHDLPADIKRRLKREISQARQRNPSLEGVHLSPESLYSAMQYCVGVRFSDMPSGIEELVLSFLSYDWDEKTEPDRVVSVNVVPMFGTIGVFSVDTTRNPRVPVKGQKWFQDKFNYESTTCICRKCLGTHPRQTG